MKKNRLHHLFDWMSIGKEEASLPVMSEDLLVYSVVKQGDINFLARLYLESGASILESIDEEGRTPLVTAILNGREDIAYLLVALGARLEPASEWIRRKGGSDDVYLMMGEVGLWESKRRMGMDLFRLRDTSGLNILDKAAKRGQLDLVKLCLERGIWPFEGDARDQRTALHWAAAGGHGAVAALLLKQAKHLSDIVHKDRLGHTAVQVAMDAKNHEALCGRPDEARRYQAVIDAYHLTWESLYDKATAA